jgi:antitoxin component of MazEF toxin-antitoxin module
MARSSRKTQGKIAGGGSEKSGTCLTLVRQPRYSLEELLAGYNSDKPISEQERQWMDAPPAGNESF